MPAPLNDAVAVPRWGSAAPGYRPRRSRRALVLALVVHLTLFGLLAASLRWRTRERVATGAPLLVQLLPSRHVPVREHRPTAARARPMRGARPPTSARIAAPVTAFPLDAPSPLAAAAAASAASAPPLQIDPSTLRRAVREAARGPSIGEQAALASDEPARPTRQQALGQGIARGAHGDCLKGEYAGGGMGLLSLPFFLAAQASGHCAK